MTKTPPSRRGITFEVGAQLEARDRLKNWYQANIEKINYEDEKVLIHYRQWSHRYDEWFDWTSPYLRPLDRVQLRREGLQDNQPTSVFRVNEKVLACWVDCRYYPAKVLDVRRDASYTVKFFDGVVKTVKPTKIKPYRAEVSTPIPLLVHRQRMVDWNGKARERTRREQNNGKHKPKEYKKDETNECKKRSTDLNGETNREGEIKKEDQEKTVNSNVETIDKNRNMNGEEVKMEAGGGKKETQANEDGQAVQTNREDVSLNVERLSSTQKPEEKKQDDVSGQNPQVPRRNRYRASEDTLNAVPCMSFLVYRVIKNQPPPILSIELDHNPFKCKAPGCMKSFRKPSLLHYHVKYYHADMEPASGSSMQTRAAEKQAGSQETPRRRRITSGSTHSPLGDRQSANGVNRHRRSSLSDRRKENQHTNRLHEERECDTGEEKMERDHNKQKKRKKKRKSDESDWSTVSAEWTDEDIESELDVTTPMSEHSVSMVTEGSDVVRCVCGAEEENEFMIQCDECLCWQHGSCMGLFEHNVPDTYNCYICRAPPAQRRSQRYWYDRDWLSSGHMYGLSFLNENYSHQNGKKITATHQLLGDVHHVFQVLNGLQLKMNILQTHTHSDLKLWCQPWKQEEDLVRSYSMEASRAPSPAVRDRELSCEALRGISVSTPSEKPNMSQRSPARFQDSYTSYISSEHCYQKPRAYYPAVEQRLVVETRRGSELEDSLRSTENLLELEQRYGGPLDPDRAKLYPSSLLQDGESEVEVKTEEAEPSTDTKPHPDKESPLHQQWQMNLLDHIEAMHSQVTQRMDLIEKELDVLESWLDYTGELEPPDPLTRLPQLKHRIRQMLTDLGTVQQISLCSSNR
uniref:C2H2-type domain-containing protein n=1 Tax=Esox lucius TaxID=8010 RepID=A0AAY5KGE7_ESOLU